MNARVTKVVQDLIAATGKVLADNNVTREEYRQGIRYLAKIQAEKEIPLLTDVFLEHLVIKAEDKRGDNSPQAIEGPYFIEDIPSVKGALKVSPEDKGEPLVVRGSVSAPDGKPVKDATVFVWHSTPDGAYSGFHKGIPKDFYRGKLTTGSDGKFEITTTLPVPYTIPDKGPVGALIAMMGHHTWRPAHVHFKVRKEGFREFTTQAYFEGGKWIDDDVAGGIVDALIFPIGQEGGNKILKVDFILNSVKNVEAAE
jgi:chlorocatechol 1,2-dioxygenase